MSIMRVTSTIGWNQCCHFHPKSEAVKSIGGLLLCVACCEDMAKELLEGIRSDTAQDQWEAGQERCE
jgi:hypothetical protein